MAVLAGLKLSVNNLDDALATLARVLDGQGAITPLPGGTTAQARDHAHYLSRVLRVGEEIGDDIAVVVATSGSTGTPKGALLSADAITASVHATHDYLGGAGDWLLALPPYHIAGLQVMMRSIIGGGQLHAIDVSDGFYVDDFIDAAQHLAAARPGQRRYTSLVPLQLAKLLDTIAGIDALRLFDAVLIGGGRIDPGLMTSCKNLQITAVTTYGSSETAGGCVYNGHPIGDTLVEIGDNQEIFIKTSSLASGWRNPPEADPFAVRPGWYATGDTGILDPDTGALQVTGRLDTMIDTGGLKIHPELLEEQLLALDGVDAACVVGIPDNKFGHVLGCGYTGDAYPLSLVAAFEDLPRWQLPKIFLPLDPFPMIGPGKPDRAAITRAVTQAYQKQTRG